MNHSKQIGEILDLYELKNIRQLEEKIMDLKRNNSDKKEIKLLEFVLCVYNEDCLIDIDIE